MVYYSILAVIGIFFNVWLYVDDIRNRGGILDAIDDGTGQNNKDLMSTPVATNRRSEAVRAMQASNSDEDAELEMNYDSQVESPAKVDLLTYKSDKDVRNSLRRSLAKQSMSKTH